MSSNPEDRPPLGYIASKVIGRGRYPSAGKAAATVLLDHVNWKTFRYDPSMDRLVRLVPFVRSNIQSGLKSLKADGLLIIHRHGGRSGRNSYEFNWDEILRRDAEFQKVLHSRRDPTRIQGKACSDIRAQTLSKNPKKEPGEVRASTEPPPASKVSNGQARRDIASSNHAANQSPSSREAAEAVHFRRWDADVRNHFSGDVDAYAVALELIDVHVQHDATIAEMKRRGDGLRVILDHVRSIRPELVAGRHRGSGHD